MCVVCGCNVAQGHGAVAAVTPGAAAPADLRYGAGPAGTVYLADLGAEVIKIENLREGGDVGGSLEQAG